MNLFWIVFGDGYVHPVGFPTQEGARAQIALWHSMGLNAAWPEIVEADEGYALRTQTERDKGRDGDAS